VRTAQNSRTVKNVGVFSVLLFFSAPGALGQRTPQIPTSNVSHSDRIQIDSTIQLYLAAYQNKSLPKLLAVWPGLQKQKKECGKMKHHFADTSLSNEELTITPIEIHGTDDGAAVRVQRVEKFVESESSSSLVSGDLLFGSPLFGGPQNQSIPMNKPVVDVRTRDIKKSDEVWITMRRANNGWTIVSIGEKNPI
jgi:hypothetical protein